MNVTMPDGTVVQNVPEGTSKELVMYRYQQKKLPPEYAPDATPMEAFGLGVADMGLSMGQGIKNLYAKATDNPQMQANVAQSAQERQTLMAPVREQNPVAFTMGSMAPGLATMPLSGGLMAQSALGAGMAGAEYNENQGTQSAIGAVLSGAGYGVGKGLGIVGSKIKNAVTSGGRGGPQPGAGGEVQRLSERAETLGMNVTPGQRLDNLPMKQLEASAKSSPSVSGLMQKGMDENQAVINQLAAQSIGESGDEVTGAMLGRASDRMSDFYNSVGRDVDAVPLRGLPEFQQNLSVDSTAYIENYAKRFPGLQVGNVSGEEAAKLRQIIAKDMRNAWRNKPSVAEDLGEFQSIILDGLEEAQPGIADELRRVNTQYRNLMALERAKTVTKGNVNPRSLDSSLRKFDKGGYLRGRNESDYYDAVRIANQFSDVVGDSGTATRNWLQYMNPANAAEALAMRPIWSQYMQSGSPAMMGLMGAAPAEVVGAAGRAGGGAGRGLFGGNSE